MSKFGRYRDHVVDGLAAGLTLDQVDEELIVDAPLDEDEKAALWLYGYTLLDLHKPLGPSTGELEPVGAG